MSRHRASSRRPERATLLAALSCVVLATGIVLGVSTYDSHVSPECLTDRSVSAWWDC